MLKGQYKNIGEIISIPINFSLNSEEFKEEFINKDSIMYLKSDFSILEPETSKEICFLENLEKFLEKQSKLIFICDFYKNTVLLFQDEDIHLKTIIFYCYENPNTNEEMFEVEFTEISKKIASENEYLKNKSILIQYDTYSSRKFGITWCKDNTSCRVENLTEALKIANNK